MLFLLQIGLFNQINLENCPGLTTLLTSGEGIEDLIKLSPEAILLRWVNHHLEKAGVARYLAYLWDQVSTPQKLLVHSKYFGMSLHFVKL